MLQFQIEPAPDITIGDDKSQTQEFVIGPLARGQGTTLGNALRRTLLGSLEGSAVTTVRIAGAAHEYATIPGVREDVLDILLNAKELVVSSRSPEAVEIGRVMMTGPAEVTAGQIHFSPHVTVVNPDQHIATVAEGHGLEMELHVERGVGYRPVERANEAVASIDTLQIDAVFMPVRRVIYSVDESAVGEGGSATENLRLEVTTNGSISPEDAIAQAAKQLILLFQPLASLGLTEQEAAEPEASAESQVPLEEINLSVRAYNCLKRAQVNTVSDLMTFSYEDLLEIKNFGSKSADEVIEALERIGVSLPKSRAKA